MSEQPAKRVKKEKGSTNLLRVSRDRRRKTKKTKKFEPEDIYERYSPPRSSRTRRKPKPWNRSPTPEPIVYEDAAEDDALYQVEYILDDRFNDELKRQEWLVKWEGYPVDQSTWEPLENVDGNVKFADYQDEKAGIALPTTDDFSWSQKDISVK